MKDQWYLKELRDYLNHCEKGGYTPRFGYLRFLKQFAANEEKEFQKILDKVYGKIYNKIRKVT